MRDFRKYEVWQLSHSLVLEVYSQTMNFPKSEQYGITSQLNRATVSVPTNISEGCGRNSDADFHRFIQISLGSAHEVEYLLQLAFDLKFIDLSNYEALNTKVNLVKQKLYHLAQKLNGK
jgi:four helix bundle protein